MRAGSRRRPSAVAGRGRQARAGRRISWHQATRRARCATGVGARGSTGEPWLRVLVLPGVRRAGRLEGARPVAMTRKAPLEDHCANRSRARIGGRWLSCAGGWTARSRPTSRSAGPPTRCVSPRSRPSIYVQAARAPASLRQRTQHGRRDIVTVQCAMGHSSATTTLSTYAHLWPTAEDKTRAAPSRMAAAVRAVTPRDQVEGSRSRQ